MGLEVLAWAALAATAYSAYEQGQAAEESAEAQKQSQAAQQRMSDVESARERVKTAREARIRRSQVLAGTGNMGMSTSGTSGAVGAVSGIQSQYGQNVGTINQMQTFAQEATAANQHAADASVDMANWQAIGGVAGSIFSGAGGFTTIFGGNTNKKVP